MFRDYGQKILWGFTKFNFKQVLKVSAFYLEKQKKVLFLKKYFFLPVVSKHAKIIPRDGASSPNFQWRFWPERLQAGPAAVLCGSSAVQYDFVAIAIFAAVITLLPPYWFLWDEFDWQVVTTQFLWQSFINVSKKAGRAPTPEATMKWTF